MEIRKIKGYENYGVDEFGNIYSFKRKIVMKQQTDNRGYKKIMLRNNNESKVLLVHRLVAQAFIPNPNNLPQVNHKDENKSNNCVDNLEWCTAQYNVNYGTREERRISNMDYSKNHRPYVPVFQLDVKGNILKKFNSLKEASESVGGNIQSIYHCCKGIQKTYKGYKWQYERSVT